MTPSTTPQPSYDPLAQVFKAEQFVPQPLEKVFAFFSRAENLETLTPPWLSFRITGKSTPEIGENTLIDYRLKIHGVPARWRTKILRWQPGVEFVDTQLKGPYALWHHTHRFEAVPGGTLMRDEVIYKVPGGRLGKLLLSWLIRRDVAQIFAFRQAKIEELFAA